MLDVIRTYIAIISLLNLQVARDEDFLNYVWKYWSFL